MPRTIATTFVPLVLAAWVGAQGPPTVVDRLHMLRADKALIGNLVDDGLGLAKAGSPLDRADGCRRTARSLAEALRQAAAGQDADRVAELGGQLEVVIREALAPNLAEARQGIDEGSPEFARLTDLRQLVLDDFDAVRAAFPEAGKVGASERVRDARGRLEGLREQLK